MQEQGDRKQLQIQALELIPTPACVLGNNGDILHLNAAWKQWDPEALDRPTLFDWAQPHGRESLEEFWAGLGARQHAAPLRCRMAPDNRWFQLRMQRPSPHALDAWICVATDIHDVMSEFKAMEQKVRLQSDLLNVTADCIKLISPSGTLLYVNNAGYQALGLAQGCSLGMEWLPLLPQKAWAPGRAALQQACAGQAASFKGYSQLPGQKAQVWDNALTPLKDGGGQVTSMICISRDVTASEDNREALLQSQERLAMASSIAGLGIWEYDLEKDLLFCDATWHRIVGRDPGDPIRTLAEFRRIIHPEDVERATEVKQTARELSARKQDYSITFRILRPNGETRWVRSAACVTTDASGAAIKATGCITDITDVLRGEMALRDANRLLEHERDTLAQRCMEDPMTRIANRRFLDSELSLICVQANLSGDPIAVCMLDVDFFKAYNDRYGHPRGDAVLCSIAAALKQTARQSDFVARYGGEEFAIVMRGRGSPYSALKRIFSAIERLAITHEQSPTGHVTVSCGCVIGRGAHLEPQALIAAADEALYEAKSKGRNRFVIRMPHALTQAAMTADMALPG